MDFLYAVAFIYTFWLGFLVYAVTQQVGWTNIPLIARVLLLPLGGVFFCVDVALNHTAAIVVLLQVPVVGGVYCPTISARMKANVAGGVSGWRLSASKFLVDHFLLPFTKNY